METFAARLASFDVALPPAKRRTSSAKTAKPITWPHHRPSPAELAHAGFYYKPYETNPDNTACFLCERALDGWEEDDNPITEHLKHSSECGWAIMMDIQQRSSNPAEIEDPTSSRIVEARKATFGSAWPHDGKRGWVCQSDKMVEGGWYFCPTEESADLASCAYCKLSLDGWEPKDDPYYEHYRRSSDCSFFVFAQPPGKKTKAPRSKKSRTSKASRLSTQSVATAVSEAPAAAFDDMNDQSIISQLDAKATKNTKKSSKSKAKGGKAKKEDPVEVGSQMDLDSNDGRQPEMSKPKQTTRGKKRLSSEMSEDEQGREYMDNPVQPEPPAKRRATKSRNSVQLSTVNETVETIIPEEPTSKAEPKKSRKGTKKGSSSTRKASRTSAASKASLRSRVPDDADIDAALSEIDAALEADLSRHAPDNSESQAAEAAPDQFVGRSSDISKSRKRSTTASKAHVRETREESDDVEGAQPQEELNAQNEPDEIKSEENEMPPSKTKPPKTASKQKGANNKKSKAQDIPRQPESTARNSESFNTADGTSTGLEHHDSSVSVEIKLRDPTRESDMEPASKPAPKKVSKKKATAGKTKKTAKATKMATGPTESESEKEEPVAENIEERRQSTIENNEEETRPNAEEDMPQQDSNRQSGVRRSSKVPPKTTRRFSDISQEHRAQSISGSRAHEPDAVQDDKPSSPVAPAQKSTPSPSPQSSDAENRPPSTRPSVTRPPVLSPSKSQTVRVPLATNTPAMSPSKRQANTGYLRTPYPWNPVDIEEILFAGSVDKENVNLTNILNGAKADLSSPEKKMTVEEWISWNAKNGEERLKRECERLVSLFEKEGGRAMRALEGIECIE
ncbi:hypothetical protein VTN00DRAFT_9391 [Thermoascus crustaceus]|uniref:uncharacterized protein n=1 Tax=Thermoascus crustaceus TaxID=5088 RepID=UPI003742200F